MIFDKASLIKGMNRKDKRFKELSTTEQDQIIQSGINYAQDRTKWFRHYEGYLLTALIAGSVNTIKSASTIGGVDSVILTKDGVKTSANLTVSINRADNYSIGLVFNDNENYTDITIETVWYKYPSVNDTIDTNPDMLDLIKFGAYMKMYEEFEDTDREARNKQRFEHVLGTGSLNLVNEFNEIPMNMFN